MKKIVKTRETVRCFICGQLIIGVRVVRHKWRDDSHALQVRYAHESCDKRREILHRKFTE